jgi:hypothetical protein
VLAPVAQEPHDLVFRVLRCGDGDRGTLRTRRRVAFRHTHGILAVARVRGREIVIKIAAAVDAHQSGIATTVNGPAVDPV